MPCKTKVQRLYAGHTSSCPAAVASFLLPKSDDIVTDPYCLTWPLNCENCSVYGRSDARTAAQNEREKPNVGDLKRFRCEH
jgi:hypothetical protein